MVAGGWLREKVQWWSIWCSIVVLSAIAPLSIVYWLSVGTVWICQVASRIATQPQSPEDPPFLTTLWDYDRFPFAGLFSELSSSAPASVSTLVEWVWRVYSALEVLFYLFYLLNWSRLHHLRPHLATTHRLMTQAERQTMFERCLSTIVDGPSYVSGWFFGTRFDELRRENIKDFLCCAFFSDYFERVEAMATVSSEAEDLDDSPATFSFGQQDEDVQGYLEELENMVQAFELRYRVKIPHGRNQSCRCIRMSLDPLDPRHRPLIFYATLSLVDTVFDLYMHYILGFRKYYSRTEQELLAAWGRRSDTKFHTESRLSYYYRPGKVSRTDSCVSPVIFIHGIGVGLFGYAEFLKEMCMETDRPIFAVQLPHVSSLLYPVYQSLSEDVPSIQDTVQAIENMLCRHLVPLNERMSLRKKPLVPKSTFIGHSLGSGVVAYLVRERPQLVQKAIFLDPICFMLHLHDLAFNFLYRKPSRPVELLLWWFASRELYISWALHRCFYWHQNDLFIEDIPDSIEVNVILGSEDSIVPSAMVREYLMNSGRCTLANIETVEKSLSAEDGPSFPRFTLFFYEGRDHAQCLFEKKFLRDVVHISLGIVSYDVHSPSIAESYQLADDSANGDSCEEVRSIRRTASSDSFSSLKASLTSLEDLVRWLQGRSLLNPEWTSSEHLKLESAETRVSLAVH